MTMNQVIPAQLIEVAAKGNKVLAEIETRLSELAQSEVNFSRLRIKIGMLLKEVQDKQYWREGHKSFGDYVASLETKYHRSRTQCYLYLRLCNELLPDLGEERLSNMGVEKAKLLSQAKEATGFLPAPEVVELAANEKVTAKELKQRLLSDKQLPDMPATKCYSLDYFADEDRRATISEAFASAIRTAEIKTDSEEERNGAVLEALSQEYLNTYPEVEGL